MMTQSTSPARFAPAAQNYTIELPSGGARLFINLATFPKDPPSPVIVQRAVDLLGSLQVGHEALVEMVKHMIEEGRLHSGSTEASLQRGFNEAYGEPKQVEVPYLATPIEEQMRWLQQSAQHGR